MIPLAAFLALIPATPPPSTGQADARPVALERKLRGTWRGGACGGDLIFKPNGAFERQHYGPAGHALSGTWMVRWDALPPTLVLTCTDADWAGEIGTRREVKIVRLDDAALAYLHSGSDEPTEYKRVKK